RIQEYVAAYDVMHGFYKSIILGILLATVGCYKGYHAAGGARGVGNATTQAVVISSISVFVLDYVLSALLMKFEPTYNAVSY
ncbi:MAG TPA: ABC transporter permease, partial [Myxococcota bacterium]|nr:ABC transporter permease [Myxococcota bacterium]